MSNNIVILATYPFSRAEIIKERLMEEGIECSLSNVHAISTIPGGAVRIWVLEEDYATAVAILIEMEEEFAEEKVEDVEIVEDIERILCPINFSDVSFEAAKYALHIASELKSEIYLVHAYNFPIVQSVDFMDTNAIAFTEDKTFTEIQQSAEQGMVDFVARFKEYAQVVGLEQTSVKSFLINGHPADEIIRFAEDKEMHAIVINNRTGEEDEKVSFVAEQIIEHAKIPVLAIPLKAKFASISNVQVIYITHNSDADFYSVKKLLTLLYPFNVHIHCLSVNEDLQISQLQTQKWKLHFEKRYSGFGFSCYQSTPEELMQNLEKLAKEIPLDMISTVSHHKGFFQELFHPGFDKKYLFDLGLPVFVFHD